MKAGHELPINATAARVMARGESFYCRPCETTVDSSLPIETRPIPADYRMNPDFVDFTGKQIGRVKVMGLAAAKSGRWVCKCRCGSYVLRRASALRGERAGSSPCDQCYLLAVSKRNEFQRRTGIERFTEEFLA